jgi:hypothetical protein
MPPAIPARPTPAGSRDFDKGAVKKFAIDPHGMAAAWRLSL